jgi:fructokinase
MRPSKPLLGGVELGGTKCVCLIGTGPDDIRAQISIPTGGDSNTTLSRIEAIFHGWKTEYGPIAA